MVEGYLVTLYLFLQQKNCKNLVFPVSSRGALAGSVDGAGGSYSLVPRKSLFQASKRFSLIPAIQQGR